MAITISEARIRQVTDVITRWTESFQPFDEGNTVENFLSCFDPAAEWYDHGFFAVRVGHESILGLHASFLHCNQPFKATIKSLCPTAEGAFVEQVWAGTCANDIVRPDGSVIVKGSGREFRTHVGSVVKVNAEGKITRIDEYDHRYWDEGRPESTYIRIGSVGHKA